MPPRPGFRPGGSMFLSEEEKQQRPTVDKALILRIVSYLKPYTKQLIIVFIAIMVSSVLSIYPSILTGKIIDEGLIGRNMDKLIFYIVLSLSVTLASNLIGVLESYLNAWIAQHITFDMRNQMYCHLQSMSQHFFTTSPQGEIITRMTSDIDGVNHVIAGTFTNILTNTITLIVALVAMFDKNPILAIAGILFVPIFTLPTRKAGQTRWTITKEAQECNDEMNSILNETLSVSGQLLVKLFNKEEQEYQKYKAINEKMIGLNIKESMAGRWFFVLISTLASVGPMVLYFVGGVLMMKYNADLTVGDITVMVALLSRMYGPVNTLLSLQVDWIRSMAMFTRIFEYFDKEPDIQQPKNPIIPTTIEGNIGFDHVYFQYNEERMILKDINFQLKSGHSLAIVGPSGSGKSTIVNLIPRLYDVTDGKVTFDGIDVRNWDLETLRSEVGIVSQETYLFNGTIRENLLYAKPNATQEEMEIACKKANIHSFITSLEHGYDTEVGNRGLKLSGGEKQRLSIARVLLKDPWILIFDEATSALDSISEKAIQEAIEPLMEERTSLLIAHRLSTILKADEILVVEDGRIVERGTHQSLLAQNGAYTELYNTQFTVEQTKV